MIYDSSDGAKSRIQRLERAHNFAAAILGLNHVQLERLVSQMYDHKGELHIVWISSKPTDMQKAAFSKAWEMCGEQPKNVNHFVDDMWSEDV